MAYWKLVAECPHCGIRAYGEDEVEKIFGFRTVNGKRIPQDYCKKCR